MKILYDVEQLMKEVKGAHSGIFRVADELFRRLANHQDIDLYPLVTDKRGDLLYYLQSIGHEDLYAKALFMPKLKKTTKGHSFFHRIMGKFAFIRYAKKYNARLKNYDWYFSPASAISPIVYKSDINVALFVHDLIPIVRPDLTTNDKFNNKYRWWMKSASPDLIFFNSESSQNDFLNFRCDFDKSKTSVTYLAADNKFKKLEDINQINKAKAKYGIDSQQYILALSDLGKRKNFPHLIRSFIRFLENTNAHDVKLVIAGPKRDSYNDIILTINDYEHYKNNIILTGFIAEEDVATLYSGASMFIYPSLYEGFGLPILEAMQCGTPVICSNNSSLPEVAGNAALYISGLDEEETASAIERLFSDANLKKDLSHKAINRSAQFSWKTCINNIVEKMIANGA